MKQHNHDILSTVLVLYLCLVSHSDRILGEIQQSSNRGSQLEMHMYYTTGQCRANIIREVTEATS